MCNFAMLNAEVIVSQMDLLFGKTLLETFLNPHTKMNSRWIKDIDLKKKNRAKEVLVGDMGEYFHVVGMEEVFLFIALKLENLK